jgi:S-(hydroxymethyl)glutathione dehydrogenase/alcohol dehydrogenase
MRQALEACHRGWGVSGHRPAPARRCNPPFQLVAGRLKRHRVRRRQSRTDVPRIVDWYMTARSDRSRDHHTIPLTDINRGFDLMHAGESIHNVRCSDVTARIQGAPLSP